MMSSTVRFPLRVARWSALLGLLVLPLLTVAQPDAWRTYPALGEIVALDGSGEALWAGTRGGVFSYAPGSGEITRFSPVEGLYSVQPAAVAYDPTRAAVWVGYDEGVVDRIDVASGAVESFFDIARATQYTDRSVNRIRVQGDSLLVATAFGLVVFDAVRTEVRDTYARLGSLTPATPVNDALVAPLPDGRTGLWLATEGGVVYAPLADPNLQQPSAWTLDAQAPSPGFALAYYQDRVVLGSLDAYERGADETWTSLAFGGVEITELEVDGERLFAVSGGVIYRREDGNTTRYEVMEGETRLIDLTSVHVGPDGAVWGGDTRRGLFRLPPLGPETSNVPIELVQRVVPEGPWRNVIAELAVGPDGTLWVAQERRGARTTGVSRLDDTGWTIYSEDDPSLDLARGLYESAYVAPNGTFYAGSLGDGLQEITPEGEVRTYRLENSTLQPSPGTSDYIVVGDARVDEAGWLWVTNRNTARPLHVRAPDGTWTALPHPPGVTSTASFDRFIFDDFGQIWVTAFAGASSAGAGLIAVSTGADPMSPADDQGVQLIGAPAVGTGLPDDNVNAVVQDASGRLWIGTDRGLATVFSPGSAFGGDPALVQPQWARTPDGTSFFLRDLNIADIAVDPADQKWLASSTGLWLINADGDTVLEHFTTENSPLFSDNVVAVAVDATTGRVYVATDRGLLSYDAEATAAAETVADLDVAPSPFRPGQHSRGVLISGLVEATTVRIVTVDGQVVATLDGRGGTVRWDGRDDRTGTPVASGVYLVAAVAADGRGTAYGKIAVVR